MNNGNTLKVPTETTDICYTISIPKLKEPALSNLKLIIKAKENIIKNALGVASLPIEEVEDTLTFNWLPPCATQEEIHACMVLITKMSKLALKLKRVNVKEKNMKNEKYAFRCFLLRLGLIGDEYKHDRKILMQNLSGSSAFRIKKGDSDVN